ncbi:YciK family oxidoreductase [Ferrimonas marina]|uniref:NAD(P)-dependent dehydrogenase, short-chain alcohol dehydrogenase family n=1 Tax=Ferrimonas marina TaxID=299255 RepID=A0A1M5SDU4_9GAMM|nr:YciK family oxidoreductase [Ferrimonas marina]SHH36605.1 NAD(P)-dependent dehydrogenase, short-chain alcohol dehydrogenase family [Ferrimonas marina]
MLEYQVQANALKNKVILVTGAGSGIGREAALQYAQAGASVILLGRTTNKLEQVYDAIVAAGGPEPAIVPLDMEGASEQNYQDLAATIEEQFGHLDGVLFNASVLGALTPFDQMELEMFQQVMQVNVTAQFLLTKALLPVLRKAPQGSIVYTSSGVGRQGRAFWGVYAISKFATEGMMQTLADELAGSNVRANCINPGATRTKMRATAFPAEDPQTLRTAEDLMPLYLYLMSDDSAEVNGQSLDAQPDRIPGASVSR